MDIVQVGIAALGEGAQQIERRRRLGIGLDQPLRVGNARLAGEFAAVDIVAAIGGQRDAVLGLGVVGTGLGELAGDATHLHHRHAGGEGQHHCHLQHHPESVTDIVGVEFGKALGAIPTLQQERLAFGGLAERGHQIARLARENQGRMGF